MLIKYGVNVISGLLCALVTNMQVIKIQLHQLFRGQSQLLWYTCSAKYALQENLVCKQLTNMTKKQLINVLLTAKCKLFR